MVEVEAYFAFAHESFVAGGHGAVVVHDEFAGVRQNPDLAADQVGGDGVLVHAHADLRLAVDAGVEPASGFEMVLGKGGQVRLLDGEVFTDGVGS